MNSSLAETWAPRALAILRIVAALIFLAHGTQKLFGFPAPPSGNFPPVMSLPWIAAFIEIGGGLLLLLGVFVRPAAFVMSGTMAVAYWMAHAPRSPFPVNNGGDAAILYCFVFLYIFVAGGGAWTLSSSRQERDELAASRR